MKQLSLMLNQSKQGEIVDLLQQLPEVNAYTIFHGEGHFRGNIASFESVRDEVMGFVPRIRIDLLLEDTAVEAVLEKIQRCTGCATHGGVYWLSPIDRMGEL